MSLTDMSNRPSEDQLIKELLEREALEDRDEHPWLTREIVRYLLKYFIIERRPR